MKLTWTIEGDELWGHLPSGCPFTAYAVKDSETCGSEAWSQRGPAPRLLGTFAGPQEAMAACEKEAGE